MKIQKICNVSEVALVLWCVWAGSVAQCRSLKIPPATEERFSLAVLDIANRFFPKDRAIVVQIAASTKCPEEVLFSTTLATSVLTSLNQQMIVCGCVDFDEADLHFLKGGSMIILLPSLDSFTVMFNASLEYLNRVKRKIGILDLRLLVVSEDAPSPESREDVAVGFLNAFWVLHSIADAVMVFPMYTIKSSPLLVYGWTLEMQNDPCFSRLTNVAFLDRWIVKEKKFRKLANLFPSKEIRSMHGCTLKLMMYDYPPFCFVIPGINRVTGSIPVIAKRLKQKLGLNLEVVPFGRSRPHMILPYMNECKTAYPYYFDRQLWYVQIPHWQGIFRVWTLVFLSFLLGSVTFWLMDCASLSQALLSTLESFLSHSASFNGSGPRFGFLLVLWLFYCLQVYTLYQSQLISFLARPGEFPPISTLEELDASDLQKWTMVITTDVSSAKSLAKFPVCNFLGCFRKLVAHKNTSVLADELFFNVCKHFYVTGGKPEVVPINQPHRVSFVSTFFAVLRCQIVKRMNDVIGRLYDTGNLVGSFRRVNNFISIKLVKDEPAMFPVALSQFQSPLCVLVCGLLVAFLSFLGEVLFHRY
ncbi:Ionotropic receptor 567 [Blattella germanica]|nr:Ionotropic receptor 567 [Blattella germanica]